MKARNVVEWYTETAIEFDKEYGSTKSFKERRRIWEKMIDKYSNYHGRVLDIGCGSGIFSFYLAERNRSVIAIDASNEMIKICQEKKNQFSMNNINFLHCDIDSYGQISSHEKVDLIICSSVLEYLDSFERSLKLLSSLMKKHGILIFSMPNRSSLYRRIEPTIFKFTGYPRYYEYVKNIYTFAEVRTKFRECNLNILESAYYGQTMCVSKVCRTLGLSKYSDNLFLAVAQLSD
jgi:ubiquinone/menaquinone biosynthesis C-methylase UbiE